LSKEQERRGRAAPTSAAPAPAAATAKRDTGKRAGDDARPDTTPKLRRALAAGQLAGTESPDRIEYWLDQYARVAQRPSSHGA
jgi:hypothetical protein